MKKRTVLSIALSLTTLICFAACGMAEDLQPTLTGTTWCKPDSPTSEELGFEEDALRFSTSSEYGDPELPTMSFSSNTIKIEYFKGNEVKLKGKNETKLELSDDGMTLTAQPAFLKPADEEVWYRGIMVEGREKDPRYRVVIDVDGDLIEAHPNSVSLYDDIMTLKIDVDQLTEESVSSITVDCVWYDENDNTLDEFNNTYDFSADADKDSKSKLDLEIKSEMGNYDEISYCIAKLQAK